MEDNTNPTPTTPNTNQPQTVQTAAQPAPQTPPQVTPVSGEDPGKTTGIIALVLAFFVPLIGLIVGIIAKSTSKKAGFKNTPALIAIILSSIFMAIVVVGLFLIIVFGATASLQVSQKCKELGPGVHYEGNTTYTCGADGSASSSSSSSSSNSGTSRQYQNAY